MYDDKPLNKDITLLDISYIYAWRRVDFYQIFSQINKIYLESAYETFLQDN